MKCDSTVLEVPRSSGFRFWCTGRLQPSGGGCKLVKQNKHEVVETNYLQLICYNCHDDTMSCIASVVPTTVMNAQKQMNQTSKVTRAPHRSTPALRSSISRQSGGVAANIVHATEPKSPTRSPTCGTTTVRAMQAATSDSRCVVLRTSHFCPDGTSGGTVSLSLYLRLRSLPMILPSGAESTSSPTLVVVGASDSLVSGRVGTARLGLGRGLASGSSGLIVRVKAVETTAVHLTPPQRHGPDV